jgi:hypothetical protein
MSGELWLDQYKAMLRALPPRDDREFAGVLARYRAGNEQAGREITGSFLRHALDTAERIAEETGKPLPKAVLEHANAGLVDALESFTGASSEEFARHAEECIRRRLASFSSLD